MQFEYSDSHEHVIRICSHVQESGVNNVVFSGGHLETTK